MTPVSHFSKYYLIEKAGQHIGGDYPSLFKEYKSKQNIDSEGNDKSGHKDEYEDN